MTSDALKTNYSSIMPKRKNFLNSHIKFAMTET